MSLQQTLSRLRRLRLGGMAGALERQCEQPRTYDDLSFTERIGLLVERECVEREGRKQQRLVKEARFRLRAHLGDIDYSHPRNLDKSRIAQLAEGEWVARGMNLLVTGPCGSGKTWIACALGHNACMMGITVRYYRVSRLFVELAQAKAEGSYNRLLAKLARVGVLIIDDWGMEKTTTAQRYDLMEIMDDRYGENSTVIISQLPVSEWYGAIGDNTVADAILDRLVHNSHRLELGGESMRKIVAEREKDRDGGGCRDA